jgi:hypothetical protein
VPAGGATVHGGYAFHYTAPNRSSEPRRALILTGRLPPVKRASVLVHSWQEEERSSHTEKEKRA